MEIAAVALATIILAALHVAGGKLRFISYVPRSGWLSFAGGVSVAYVFIHLLPEVARGADLVAEEMDDIAVAEHALWLVALIGLSLFYWVETVTRRSREQMRGERASTAGAFWVSIGFYALYNSIIGYVLHARAEAGSVELAAFSVAIGLHFVVNDFSMREHHKRRYHSFGRWILVAAIAVGAAIGVVTRIPEVALVTTVSLIAGGVVLNVFKEELPYEAESRFGAFGAGLVGYALLLLAL